MTYQLDTSGAVVRRDYLLGEPCNVATQWGDLSPFAQGYVEAMFASLRPDFYRIKAGVKPYGGKRLKVAYRAFDPDGGPLREVIGYVHVSASKVATAQRLYRVDELEMPTFSDLAPETLVRIIADCEAMERHLRRERMKTAGGRAWELRQSGFWPKTWPPLTIRLGDDGKVRFA